MNAPQSNYCTLSGPALLKKYSGGTASVYCKTSFRTGIFKSTVMQIK